MKGLGFCKVINFLFIQLLPLKIIPMKITDFNDYEAQYKHSRLRSSIQAFG